MIKVLLVFCVSVSAFASVDFKRIFAERDGCFFLSDLQTGKVVAEFNRERCQTRFSPYSSFKIAAAIMAFEKGVFKTENQIIPWDRVKRGRGEIDKDQTPLTFMSNSVKWVTEWIMPQLGRDQIQAFLKSFNYGNQDFSGGLKDAWVSSSLKISAREQVDFLAAFWGNRLGLSDRTTELTKKVMSVQKVGKDFELYGKTGTGCLFGHSCLDRPDKMIGWFVGILKTHSKSYAFAGNASDLSPQGPPAGPRMRKATIEILKQMNLD